MHLDGEQVIVCYTGTRNGTNELLNNINKTITKDLSSIRILYYYNQLQNLKFVKILVISNAFQKKFELLY